MNLKNNRGVTLLEALVAILILLIVMVGVVTATMKGATYVMSTTHRIISQAIAQGEIGKLRVLGYNAVAAMTGTTSFPILIDEGNPEVTNDSLTGTMYRTVTPLDLDGNGSTDMYKLDISIRWVEFDQSYEQKSTSLLTKRSFSS